MTRRAAISLALVLAASGLSLVGAEHAGYRINTTSSMPRGVWRMETAPERLTRGMIVIVCLPPRLLVEVALQRGYIAPGKCPSRIEPLLKPVVALAGDIVRVTEAGITVNGELLPHSAPLVHDSAGRALHSVQPGRSAVEREQVWLVAGTDTSFDSRYWGPVPVSAIQGIAQPVLTFR